MRKEALPVGEQGEGKGETMTKNTKPLRTGRGFVGGKDGKFVNCLSPTTKPRALQLIGAFDRDTFNAVILLAREVR